MLLSYINTISLLIFFATAGFFLWEIFQFFKEYRKKKIKLPSFSEKVYSSQKLSQATPLKINKNQKARRVNPSTIVFAIVGVLTVSGFAFITLRSTQRSSAYRLEKNPVVKELASRGIAIFDENWNEISEEQLKPGQQVYIGIYKPPLEDIDKGRIRVNENVWKNEHETEEYNSEKGVFYIFWKVPTDSARILIEAQLHSKNSGWLTD